jgi:hypothetical protein
VCGNIFFFKYRQVVNYVIFLQSLWQEHDSGSRLAMVNPYLFGSDIPEAISKPCTDEGNEVSQLTVVMAPHTVMFFFLEAGKLCIFVFKRESERAFSLAVKVPR